jgi:hypothetical protein
MALLCQVCTTDRSRAKLEIVKREELDGLALSVHPLFAYFFAVFS